VYVILAYIITDCATATLKDTALATLGEEALTRETVAYCRVAQIRRDLRNRLAILYNPGKSRVVRNERLRQQNATSS
jgi:hypothetical protein